MISKNDLLETEKKFYSSFSSYKNNSERFNRTKDYFNWITRMLNEVIDNGEGCEEQQLLVQQQGTLILNLVKWLETEHVIVKEFSTGWNGSLVKRVANFISTYKELKEQPKDEQTAKHGSIFKKVMDEQDFATLAYCCQMLWRDGVIETFIKKNVTENPTPSTEVDYVMRPGSNGRMIKDFNGTKYYHVDAKREMTYDECTDLGLSHHLLYNRKTNGYMGFIEPNQEIRQKSKLTVEEEKMVDELVNTIFVESTEI